MKAGIDPTTMVVFQDDGEPNPQALLGVLCWFSISKDIAVTAEQLRELFATHNLDMKFFPSPLTAPVALRDAARLTFDQVRIAGQVNTLELVLIEDEPGMLVYILNRTFVSRREVATETIKVGHLVWRRDLNTQLLSEVLPEHADEADYEQVFNLVRERFEDNMTYYTGRVVSNIVKKMIDSTQHLMALSTGGVYIVPRESIDLVKRLHAFISDLDSGYRRTKKKGERLGESDFNYTYILDTSVQRLLVRGKLETQVGEGLDEPMSKAMGKLQRGESFGRSEILGLADQLEVQRSLVTRYEGLLHENMSTLRGKMETFEEILTRALANLTTS